MSTLFNHGPFSRIRQNHWVVIRGTGRDTLEHGSDKRFKYCFDKLGGHSGGMQNRDAKLQGFRNSKWTGPIFCIILDLLVITGLTWKGLIAGRNQRSKGKEGWLFYSCTSDERPDVDSTCRRKRTTNGSIQNEMEKCAEYSILVRSENCSTHRVRIYVNHRAM